MRDHLGHRRLHVHLVRHRRGSNVCASSQRLWPLRRGIDALYDLGLKVALHNIKDPKYEGDPEIALTVRLDLEISVI